MKTKSIFFSVLFASTVFAVLTNCSGNKKEDSVTESHDAHASHDSTELSSESITSEDVSAPQFQVDASFQQQLASVFASYVELKEAFVSSDATKVKEEATGTNEALGKVDMKLLTGVAHNDWMSYLSPIENSLKEIQSNTDIEAQRKAFSTLSDNLYKSIKAFGLGGKEAFYDFCPMAFDNAGGYWLSDQKQIRNPYFGDKMLTCGSIQETLQ